VILGTAGHIDHGKTALVRALTGTDTDRLAEEKARGITIELGFAELATEDGARFGVVDVPGHEAFVRAMVAGAAGMDVVLLVVAADEGVMPQTREHLAIVEILGVPELVVALTKSDSVEGEWMELVHADVLDLLDGTRYRDAPRVETSAMTGAGLHELVVALRAAAERVATTGADDLVRLPLDRVFTIQGTGTVVTGTLWSGRLDSSHRVRVLPQGLDARVRGIEVHGRSTGKAEAGDRVAVALSGDGGDRDRIARGSTVVTDGSWEPTHMLTTRIDLLADTAWSLEHNQRVHVHLGTAEVRARCALLGPGALGPGDRGWVQLRLEEPLVARAGDRFVIRAYSPVSTIGGGVVAEPNPPKRRQIDDATRSLLTEVVDGSALEAVRACVELAGPRGVAREALPIVSGVSLAQLSEVMTRLEDEGITASGRLVFGRAARAEAEQLVETAVKRGHADDGLRSAVPLAEVRSVFPAWAPRELGAGAIDNLVEQGRVEAVDGGLRMPGFVPVLTSEQVEVSAALLEALTGSGLAAPLVDELPERLRSRADLRPLLRRLEERGEVRTVAEGLYIGSDELDRAAARIEDALAGRSGLGPADCREVLPVSRKHLIPLLNYFDGVGVTLRDGGGRSVPGRQ
jgi:selenocysteine-specific elongation factor